MSRKSIRRAARCVARNSAAMRIHAQLGGSACSRLSQHHTKARSTGRDAPAGAPLI